MRYELVYFDGATVAHAVTDGTANALCGRTPWPGDWLDDEVKDQLPLCVGCKAVIFHQQQHH